MTKILFLGDIFSQVGCLLVETRLPALIGREGLDLCLANAENAQDGTGLSLASAQKLLDSGLDALSGGNHTFRFHELESMLDSHQRLIRPANYPDPCPGRGWTILKCPSGVKVGFANLMGRVYMKGALDCPFKKADQLIGEMRDKGANILIVDFHAEVTSEKVALARYLDGRVEAVIGTHTHVQTNDARILPGGTAYITDAGMTGPHGGIIGMQSQEVIDSFIMGRTKRFKPAKKLPILQGVIMVFDTTGRAESITPVNLEGLA